MLFLPHTAVVKRINPTLASGDESQGAWTTVQASLACLVEPMGAWRQATILGQVGGRRYVISWGSEVLREGDRVEVLGRRFTLELEADDQHRTAGATTIPGYQTGRLEEDPVNTLS